VTKKDIVKEICDKTSLPYSQVRVVVQSTIDAIIETVLKEGKIELRNFGVFKIKQRAPRKARDPRTGAPVFVPAKRVVTFKAGRLLEKRLK
jgi:integration host factor subunit beta